LRRWSVDDETPGCRDAGMPGSVAAAPPVPSGEQPATPRANTVERDPLCAAYNCRVAWLFLSVTPANAGVQ
jgi:hypothetical protein